MEPRDPTTRETGDPGVTRARGPGHPDTEETGIELGAARLSWPAIWGGTFLALGLMLLFTWFGTAIGLSVADTATQASGIWMAVWTFLVPIIALFLGGFLAARYSGLLNNMGGAAQGAVTWGITTVISALVLGLVVAGLLGGAARLTGNVLGATGQAVGGVNVEQVMQTAGVDAQDLLQPINQQRQAEGQEPIQAQNLEVALQDAVDRSLQQGQVNQAILVDSLVANTALTQQEAQQVASDVQARISAVGGDIQGAADAALDALASSTWYLFFSSLLSLLAAMGGGALATTRTRRKPMVEHVRTTMPGLYGREVYP